MTGGQLEASAHSAESALLFLERFAVLLTFPFFIEHWPSALTDAWRLLTRNPGRSVEAR